MAVAERLNEASARAERRDLEVRLWNATEARFIRSVGAKSGQEEIWQPVFFGGYWRKLSTFSLSELEQRVRDAERYWTMVP